MNILTQRGGGILRSLYPYSGYLLLGMVGLGAGFLGLLGIVLAAFAWLVLWLWPWGGLARINDGAELVFIMLTGKPSDPEVWEKGEMKALVKRGFNWRAMVYERIEADKRRKAEDGPRKEDAQTVHR